MIIYTYAEQNVEVPFDHLDGVLLENLNFHKAHMGRTNFSGSSFRNSYLRGAFCSKSIMKGCDFESTDLIGTVFSDTDLTNANLKNAKAYHTFFMNANLQNANFEGANIRHADFSNANLCGANFRYALGFDENPIFQNALYDENTLWPDGFIPANFGAVKRSLIKD